MERANRKRRHALQRVRLDDMTEAEFQDFRCQSIERYAQENVKAGYWCMEDSLQRSEAENARLLPEGLKTPDHHVLMVRDESTGVSVGLIWLKVDRSGPVPSGFIYDVFVYEEFRNKGYGKAIMSAIEVKAGEHGLRTLYLHVFAHNPVAMRLYQDSGFEVGSLNMRKRIG